MEQALYHPEHGYYASGKAAIGRSGDFYTNVSVGPLFGALLAVQFREMWERMERPDSFSIVEQGANDGQFARDVLEAAQRLAPDFFKAVRYVLVEPFDVMKRRQEEMLRPFARRVSWRSEIAPFSGIHFSNELLDAMPVHLLVFRSGAWREKCVDWNEEAFLFVECPITDEKLLRYAEMLGPFPEGSQVEANLDALAWIELVSANLERGYILFIDYGNAGATGQGTLACYKSHRRTEDPLCFPGDLDITARVDFSALARHAARLGLAIKGYADQQHFLTGLAAGGLPDVGKDRPFLAFNQLTHPNLMGAQFKALCASKGVEGALCGFAFGRDPAVALGFV